MEGFKALPSPPPSNALSPPRLRRRLSLGGSHGILDSVRGATTQGSRGRGYGRAGLYVRVDGDKEGPRPFEGLYPLPNGNLGNPVPFLSMRIHVHFCFC